MKDEFLAADKQWFAGEVRLVVACLRPRPIIGRFIQRKFDYAQIYRFVRGQFGLFGNGL